MKIAKQEFAGEKIYIAGKHKGNFFSIIFQANILKFFKLLFIILKEKPTIGFGTGYLLGAAMLVFNKKCYQFDDDPERKFVVFLEKTVSTKVFFPPIIDTTDRKICVFSALKEWAYLSPDYFTPNQNILDKYNIKPKSYIFIREVSSGSLNYMNQEEGIVLSFSHQIPESIKVILSLENKTLSNKFPKDWIILQEPVSDIHSLIYFSKVVISSGDSMAREGALLGVPSIYCGIREMVANNLLINEGMLFKVDPNSVPSFTNDLFTDEFYINNQNKFRESLRKRWINLPKFMYELLLKK
ncbi:MAG: DUF354 domain-containing protein [Bacteroidales bacterium]|nr:DUF354 domain-containing protein [Bacteroidales bacterium]